MKNIVVCCDGTGNQIGRNTSNVLKLYRIIEKSARQRVYYNPGVGTIGQQDAWQEFKQNARSVFGLATGYGLDDDVLSGYRFVCENYEEGDRIWLFGFSRGAYTVRALAALTHVIGLLRPDQMNLAGYALSAYKKSSSDRSTRNSNQSTGTRSEALEAAWDFSRVAGGRAVGMNFVGVWDTVASVIVPRKDRFLPDLQTLRFTRTNPSVKAFRHAMAIDERRRLFRLNEWKEPQEYRCNPFDPASECEQDIRQVWFAGVHADIGGGYLEKRSGLSKFPLLWMINQAQAKGLYVNRAMINHLVLGRPRKRSRHQYVGPDAAAPLNDSLTRGWRLLEFLPKSVKRQDWPDRAALFGWYFPRGEPRFIPDKAVIHESVFKRMEIVSDYRPVNLPSTYEVEEDHYSSGTQLSDGASKNVPEEADE